MFAGIHGNNTQDTPHDAPAHPPTPDRHGNLKFLHNAPFFQNGAKSGFEMCFGPSTLGAGAKTRLESRIKKLTPHCVCRPFQARLMTNASKPLERPANTMTKPHILTPFPFFQNSAKIRDLRCVLQILLRVLGANHVSMPRIGNLAFYILQTMPRCHTLGTLHSTFCKPRLESIIIIMDL